MQTRPCRKLDDLKSSSLLPGDVRGEVPAVEAVPLRGGALAESRAPLRDSCRTRRKPDDFVAKFDFAVAQLLESPESKLALERAANLLLALGRAS